MPVVRPDKFPEWALLDQVDPTTTENNVVEADAAHKDYGWPFDVPPPRNYDNWMKRYVHNWLKYSDAASCETVQGFRMSGSGANVYFGEGRARGIGGEEDAIVNTVSAFRKILDQVWTIGSNVGGRASTVTLTPDSWYHCFIIKRDSDGVVDAGFDDDITAAGLLADTGFDQYRRVASVFWVDDTSDHIKPSVHTLDDNSFLYTGESVRDYNTPVGLGPTTITLPKSAPLGLSLPVLMCVQSSGITSAWKILILDGFNGGAGVPSGQAKRLEANASLTDRGEFSVLVDTSQQMYVDVLAPSTPNLSCVIDVHGYIDRRYMPLSTWY